ncbi:unnamed protein product [Bemisia tabaci]|uniref:Pre-C2HC domain-containing protein n=1 Tax=Bemisia tabaci TaxID=7038 RepID=A0A9P0A1V5_BEMTA|nr:unnamed protein product [Bemisia tabaci]
MFKGLHHSTDTEQVMADLKKQGFNPISVVNIIRKNRVEEPKKIQKDNNTQPKPDQNDAPNSDENQNNSQGKTNPEQTNNQVENNGQANSQNNEEKNNQESEKNEENKGKQDNPDCENPSFKIIHTPLNLFAVAFDHNDDIEKIYRIKLVANMVISVEPPRPNPQNLPIQCQKCQSYNHSARYCNYLPACVRCGDEHESSQCPLPRFIPNPKCANCGQAHPANYRQCVVAVEVARERTERLKKLKERNSVNQKKEKLIQVPVTKTTLKKGISFSDSLQNKQQQQQTQVHVVQCNNLHCADNYNLLTGSQLRNERSRTLLLKQPSQIGKSFGQV